MERSAHRKSPIFPRFLRVTGLFCLLLFCIITWLVIRAQTAAFDQVVADWFGNPRKNGIAFMQFITVFASSKFLIFCYVLLVIFLLFEKRQPAALITVITGLGGFAVVYIIKELVQRPRPYRQLVTPLTNFSFPSGHACSGLLLYGLLVYFIWRGYLSPAMKWMLTAFLLFFSFFIGITRIYLGVHYASDVAAGFLLAVFFLSVSCAVLNRKRVAATSLPS